MKITWFKSLAFTEDGKRVGSVAYIAWAGTFSCHLFGEYDSSEEFGPRFPSRESAQEYFEVHWQVADAELRLGPPTRSSGFTARPSSPSSSCT